MKKRLLTIGLSIIFTVALTAAFRAFPARAYAEEAGVWSLYRDYEEWERAGEDFRLAHFTPVNGLRAENPYAYEEMVYEGNQSQTAEDVYFAGEHGIASKVKGLTGWVNDSQCDMILLSVRHANSEAGFYWTAPADGNYDLDFSASVLDNGKGEPEADGGSMRAVKASEERALELGRDRKTQEEMRNRNMQISLDGVRLTAGERIYFLIDSLDSVWYDSFPLSLTVKKSAEKNVWNMYEEYSSVEGEGDNFFVYAAQGWYAPEFSGNIAVNSVPCEFSRFERPLWNLRLKRYQGEWGSTMTADSSMVMWIQGSVDRMAAPAWRAPKDGEYYAVLKIRTTSPYAETAAEYDGARIRAGVAGENGFEVFRTYTPSTAELADWKEYKLEATVKEGEEIVFAVDGNACHWCDSFYYDLTVVEKGDAGIDFEADVPASIKANKTAVLGVSGASLDGVPLEGYEVSYGVSNREIINVDESGLLTALAEGSADVFVEVSYEGKSKLKIYGVTVTAGVKVTINGSNTMSVGAAVVLAYGAENAEEGAPVTWSSLTPDIVSVDEFGNVTGLKYGFGVVAAEVEGAVGTYNVYVNKEYSEGTVWTINDYYPFVQDEEGFSVSYAAGAAVTEEQLVSLLGRLSRDDIEMKTNWKGPGSAMFSERYCMPGEGMWGYEFQAPADGEYTVDMSAYWDGEWRNADPSVFTEEVGFVLGVAVRKAEGCELVDWKYYTYPELTGLTSWYMMRETSAELKKGETLITFLSCGKIGWWDQIVIARHSIACKTYEAPDYTPVAASLSIEFDKNSSDPLSAAVELFGKRVLAVREADAGYLLGEGDYTAQEDGILFQNAYLQGLAFGRHLFTVETEGGIGCFYVIVTGADEVNVAPAPKETGKGCGSVAGGAFLALPLAGALLIRKKREKRE